MAYPPALQPTSWTNASPQLDNHPAAHNSLAAAINDIVAKINSLYPMQAVVLTGTVAGGSGAAVFTHTFGTTPDVVQFTPAGSNWSQGNIQGRAATTVTLRCFVANGTAVADGQAVTAHFLFVDV